MGVYPGQVPITDPRIEVLKLNSNGQAFEFEEARYTDPDTFMGMYYIEAWMVGEPSKVSKHLRLDYSSIDIVEIVCMDLRRMLELAEEYARTSSLSPLGESTYEEEGEPDPE